MHRRLRRKALIRIVYLWADGIYVKAGLENGKATFLVLIRALSNDEKVVMLVILALEGGQRESVEDWSAVLRRSEDVRITWAETHHR